MKRVLIVEDSPIAVAVARAALEHAGYEVAVATSQEAFFEQLAAELPDLVLLDLGLPDGDGRSVLAQLKADDRTKDLPVLLVSMSPRERMEALVEEFGATGFVPKATLTDHSLVAAVSRTIG